MFDCLRLWLKKNQFNENEIGSVAISEHVFKHLVVLYEMCAMRFWLTYSQQH